MRGRISRRWGELVARRPWSILIAVALITALAGWRAGAALGFRTARLELVGTDVPFVQRVQALEREFGDMDAIVVALESAHVDSRRACARAIAARVDADRERFRGAFHRVDPAALGGNALLHLGPDRLVRANETIARFAATLAGDGPLAGTLAGLASELRAMSEQPPPSGERPAGAELLGATVERLFDAIDRAVAGHDPPAEPLGDPLGFEAQGWLESGDTTFVLVGGRDIEGELDPLAPSVKALRRITQDVALEFPLVTIGITGKPALQVDEMTTYESDSIRSAIAALIGVTLLQVIGLRRLLAPLLIGLCMTLAVVWTLGAATLWPGHLNLLAVVFVVIVIGLGDDYGIHLVTHYDAERRAGQAPGEALASVFAATGSAIGVAGVTTVIAFAACFLSEFRGLREFGAVAGFGVMGAALASISALPALLVLLDRRPERLPVDTSARPAPLDRAMHALDQLTARRPLVPLGVAIALTLAALVLAPRARWNPSLIDLQDPTLPSVQLELQLLRDEKLTSWFMAWAAPDLASLADAASRVKTLPEVREVQSVLDAIPPDQERAVPELRRLQGSLAAIASRAPPPFAGSRLDGALGALEDACEELGGAALGGGHGQAAERLAAWADRSAAARAALAREPLADRVASLDARLGEQHRALAARFATPPAAPIGPADLPRSLRERLIGHSGAYLLRILPRGNMWAQAELEAFVDAVQRELPEATGTPELVLRSSRLMVDGYRRAGLFALLAVSACLLAWFRAPGPALLALLTLATGALWTAGAAALLGVTINPANLVALPLLVGIGINAPVYVIHHAREHPGASLLGTSLGRALFYSALTSAVGFGSLLLSRHQGTASIGSTTAIGVIACLLAAVLVPPSILALRARK